MNKNRNEHQIRANIEIKWNVFKFEIKEKKIKNHKSKIKMNQVPKIRNENEALNIKYQNIKTI